MKIKSIHLRNIKRFTELDICELPEDAKLIVMLGPNGCGKSSVFEAFRYWLGWQGQFGLNGDPDYFPKDRSAINLPEDLKIDFHNSIPKDAMGSRKVFYFRTAYRNEADFGVSGLTKHMAAIHQPRVHRMIDNDVSVSDNYQRIVATTVERIYSGEWDTKSVSDLNKALIGEIADSMGRVFDDLVLIGPGNPLGNGTFYFQKGTSKNFHYKNLSGGEKAAFDILLDLIVKKLEYDDTIFCIDEPDLHMHSKLQGALLNEMYDLIPQNCQLWISTHSIGMMRKAVELHSKFGDQVIFLNFHEVNPDDKIVIGPSKVDREFWKKNLEVAIDDLSQLVMPKQIVICEGKPINLVGKNKEFDAKCLRTIFNEEFPETDFISVGNDKNVVAENLDITLTLRKLTTGVSFLRLIDRDDRSDSEVQELLDNGVRVLLRRDLESYLLDDEILNKLCMINSKFDKFEECINIKQMKIDASISRGNPKNDLKSAAGEIYVELKKCLGLTNCGNSVDSFLRDTMAALVTPETLVYKQLKSEIFG